MRPVRPCSKLTAASSARLAGGEPSYPTTRCKGPVGGVVVVTVVNISSGAGAVAAGPGSGALGAARGVARLRVAQGDLVRLGDGSGLDGSQSLAQALAG